MSELQVLADLLEEQGQEAGAKRMRELLGQIEMPTGVAPPERRVSEEWIRNYADELGVGYNELMDAARDHIEHGDYFSRGGQFEGVSTNPLFWDHYQNVTGRRIEDGDRGNFFSCSC